MSIGSGTFTPDTSGVFTTDSSGRSVSEETPVLYGDNANSSTYDAAFHRWIPTGPEHVLPDGSAYVYELQLADGSYEIHRVSVATAVDRVIAHMAYDNAYQVLAYQPEGVFVVPIVHRSGLAAGLWLLDPETGSIEAVPNSTDGTWAIIRDGAAWGGPGGAAGSTLVRLDLSTGTAVTWFQHPVQGAVFEGFGFGVTLMGFDRAQHPLIEVFPPGHDPSAPQSPGPPQVWLVRAPGAAAQVSGIALDGTNGIGFGISDSRGLWVVGGDGVYLYDDNGFHHMAPLGPASSPNYTVEGGCA